MGTYWAAVGFCVYVRRWVHGYGYGQVRTQNTVTLVAAVGSELLVLDTTDTIDNVLGMGDNVYPSPPVPRRELKTGYPPDERINPYKDHNMYISLD